MFYYWFLRKQKWLMSVFGIYDEIEGRKKEAHMFILKQNKATWDRACDHFSDSFFTRPVFLQHYLQLPKRSQDLSVWIFLILGYGFWIKFSCIYLLCFSKKQVWEGLIRSIKEMDLESNSISKHSSQMKDCSRSYKEMWIIHLLNDNKGLFAYP